MQIQIKKKMSVQVGQHHMCFVSWLCWVWFNLELQLQFPSWLERGCEPGASLGAHFPVPALMPWRHIRNLVCRREGTGLGGFPELLLVAPWI